MEKLQISVPAIWTMQLDVHWESLSKCKKNDIGSDFEVLYEEKPKPLYEDWSFHYV